MKRTSLIAALALVGLLTSCGGGDGGTRPGDATSETTQEAAATAGTRGTAGTGEADPVLLAVGDIGDCTSTGDEAVAALASARPGVIAALGDIVYESGLESEYVRCFVPAWGPLKERIRPAAGNHEYGSPGAKAYFDYFGAAAGEPGKGYYSYEIGAWHIVVLNSNCEAFDDGCGATSAQYRWLAADLGAHPAICTLAYWHHPRFTSGLHGDARAMSDLFALLYEQGVDVALTAHDHHYERFAPLDAARKLDTERGIREFIVGTGGGTLFPVALVTANSEVREVSTFGLLALTLHAESYDWSFEPIEGQKFRDSGSGKCHR